jgi:uncharacterized protein YdeI (YjbR/CyaY-like superfamily)
MKPVFFANRREFRSWLRRHHQDTKELLVGFYKKDSGKPSITYPEALDEALCCGWIDGVRKSFGPDSYTIRFTPRKPGSNWSAVNIKRARELVSNGRMTPAGLREFERRDESRARQYSYERATCEFDAALQRRFKANARAWEFFQAQPPGYRRIVTWRVVSAKREETRLKRLEELIAHSERGRRLTLVSLSAKTK